MKQLLQNLKTGRTECVDVPWPQIRPGSLLLKTSVSLVSAGTERMLVEFGSAGYLQKARQQPEKVRQVLDKIRTDGLLPTIDAVQSKLEQPLPLGYCHVGRILETSQVHNSNLTPGRRVISNGPHAEIVCVPQHLCAGIPDSVSDEEAAFTVLGAIGLQGVRLAQPTLGERFVVTGLGLIGLLTVQLLQAHGCQVLAIDPDAAKCALARQFGADAVELAPGVEPVDAAMAFSKGNGVDGVLITAATKSSEPVHQAAQMCRKRGRIVLVGVTGLELQRADFYKKELTFQVSCSYGPGRYDPNYEEYGHDYPLGFVRWTEQRNFEAVLELMASGKLDVKPLISHRFQFDDAEHVYELIREHSEPYLGILLKYRIEAEQTTETETIKLQSRNAHTPAASIQDAVVVGMIGAGNFTGRVLLPSLQKTGVRLKTIASRAGITGTHLGHKFRFEHSTTEPDTIFTDSEINTVFITTQHNTHAQFVLQALDSGKHIFVEKPLCLTAQELQTIIKDYTPQPATRNPQLLLVGFNRRFAPHIVKMKALLSNLREPKSLIMTVNAGYIPAEHWTQDPKTGGGRILGEVCHFVDLLRFLTGSRIEKSHIATLQAGVRDTVSISLTFADGSIGTIHYFANGNKGFPKERLEVFCDGKILQLDNFKILRGYGWNGFKQMRLWRQDKGHTAEMHAFIEAICQGLPAPIPFGEIVEVMNTTIALAQGKG